MEGWSCSLVCSMTRGWLLVGMRGWDWIGKLKHVLLDAELLPI